MITSNATRPSLDAFLQTLCTTHTELRRWLLLTVITLLSFTTHQTALADNTLSLSHSTDGQFLLAPFTTFFDPGVQNPQLRDVMQIPDTQWRPLSQKTPSMVLHPRHTIWYRIAIKNDNNEAQTLLLRDSSPITDTMASYLCLQPDDAYSCKRNIRNPYNKNLQEIYLEPNQSATLIIESSGFHSLFFSLSLQTPYAFTTQQYKNRIYFGLLDGLLCGLALYSLLIAIHTKQKAYFAYYVFGTLLSATFFIHQEFFYAFFGALTNTSLTNLSIITPLIEGVSLAFFIAYYIYADNIEKKPLTALKLYTLATIAISAGLLLNIPTVFLLPIYSATTLIILSYFFHLCLTVKKKHRLGIALLGIGITLPFFNFIYIALASIGIINSPENCLMTVQSVEAASTTLFAIAILFSIRQLQKETEEHSRLATQADITSNAHSHLLSHLNHELRTPLNGILGAAEILMHKSHLPKDRRVFSMIYHTALPLKHLIEDMVNIKSITKNKKSLQYVRFDLHNLLQECMDIFLLTAHDKKIRLYFQIDNNVTSDITADTNRLRQILINLLGNACKFTSHGVVGLHVSQEPTTTDGEHLYLFEVIDNGQGIDSSAEKKLFEIFETGHTESNPKGTGVGLSIVRDLSQLMGGSCGYKKNNNTGSTFWFSIKVIAHHSTLRKTHGAFQGLNILLADESSDLIDSIYGKISDAIETLITANTESQIISAIIETNDNPKYTGETPIDMALIHITLASDSIIHAILTANIPLLVYEDYDEITSKIKKVEHKNGYEIITRKPSVETFSLNIAEAIIRKDNIIHRYTDQTNNHTAVLIAEDIPTNQLIIEEIIKSIGLSPVTSCNGKQAVETFIQHHQASSLFNIIIMDCEMPVMDGFEATQKIRHYEKEHQLTPAFIIALSAHIEPEYRLRSKQSGMDMYLTKPVSAEILIQQIENHRRSMA